MNQSSEKTIVVLDKMIIPSLVIFTAFSMFTISITHIAAAPGEFFGQIFMTQKLLLYFSLLRVFPSQPKKSELTKLEFMASCDPTEDKNSPGRKRNPHSR